MYTEKVFKTNVSNPNYVSCIVNKTIYSYNINIFGTKVLILNGDYGN